MSALAFFKVTAAHAFMPLKRACGKRLWYTPCSPELIKSLLQQNSDYLQGM